MGLRDEPPISDSTMAYAGRNGMNLPQARSVEEAANRVRKYIGGGQAERRSPLAPVMGPQPPVADPPPLNPNRQGVQYTRFRPRPSAGSPGVLPVPGPIAPTPQTPMTARSPLASHFAGVSPDPTALHRLALGALSPNQFGSGF